LFDSDCITALTKIVEQTGTHIGISSSWKDYMTKEEINAMWIERKLLGNGSMSLNCHKNHFFAKILYFFWQTDIFLSVCYGNFAADFEKVPFFELFLKSVC
jgi:hypothetical protein